jgi:hypothetical protein
MDHPHRHTCLVFALAAVALGGCVGSVLAAEPPLRLLTASFWGTAEDDDIQGACQAPDGTVYMVGNVGAAAKDFSGGAAPVVFGQRVAEPKCGRAFVAHFSGDLGKLLHYAELADGIAIFTTAQANERGVYVSGYASDGLEPLLQGKPGLMAKYPLATEVGLVKEGKILEANGLKDKDPIAGRPGLGRYGEALRKLSPLTAIFEAAADAGKAAKAVFWTAYCQEKQGRTAEAAGLYESVGRRYAATPAARQAAERLARLRAAPAP